MPSSRSTATRQTYDEFSARYHNSVTGIQPPVLPKKTTNLDEEIVASSIHAVKGTVTTTTTELRTSSSPTPNPISKCRRIEFLFAKDVPGLQDYDTKPFEEQASILITELSHCGNGAGGGTK